MGWVAPPQAFHQLALAEPSRPAPPKGTGHVAKLAHLLEKPDGQLPESTVPVLQLMLQTLAPLDRQIAALDIEIARRAKQDPVAKRLTTVPGIGPIAATAIAALAPPLETFKKGHDFAAWVGLTPLQRSTGGKQKLGAISKMGERTLRRLLILGSNAVVLHAAKRGAPKGSWLEQMLARKPRMLVTVALANKTARIVSAEQLKVSAASAAGIAAEGPLTKNEVYRAPAAAVA